MLEVYAESKQNKIKWIKSKLTIYENEETLEIGLEKGKENKYHITLHQMEYGEVITQKTLSKYNNEKLENLYKEYVSKKEMLKAISQNGIEMGMKLVRDKQTKYRIGIAIESLLLLQYGGKKIEEKKLGEVLDNFLGSYKEGEDHKKLREIKLKEMFNASEAREETKTFIIEKATKIRKLQSELEDELSKEIQREVLELEFQLNNKMGWVR